MYNFIGYIYGKLNFWWVLNCFHPVIVNINRYAHPLRVPSSGGMFTVFYSVYKHEFQTVKILTRHDSYNGFETLGLN